MESLGTIFKEIREKNGITLEEIENTTKIRTKYLKAIEDDKFDEIPGKVYAKGFVKSYAKYLKIDQEPVIIEMIEEAFGENKAVLEESTTVEAEIPKREEKHSIVEKRPKREQPIEDKPLNQKISRIIGISALFVVLLLLVGGIYSLSNNDDEQDNINDNNIIVDSQTNTDVDDPDNIDANNTDEDTDNTDVSPITPSDSKTTYDGLNMTITLLDVQPNKIDKCWLQVMADGKLLWEETLNEGANKTVTATDSIRIKAGNAGVVQITLNDQDLGTMGSYSQVVTKEYTLDSLKNEQNTYSPGATEPISGGIYDEKPTEVSNDDPNNINPTE